MCFNANLAASVGYLIGSVITDGTCLVLKLFSTFISNSSNNLLNLQQRLIFKWHTIFWAQMFKTICCL